MLKFTKVVKQSIFAIRVLGTGALVATLFVKNTSPIMKD